MATQAAPQSLEHEQLFSDVTSLIREYLIKYSDRGSKVSVWVRGGGVRDESGGRMGRVERHYTIVPSCVGVEVVCVEGWRSEG